jgi:hypothetical protein
LTTVLLLLVLAGWIGIAFWWFVGQRSAPSDARGSFRRQLVTLERRTPGAGRRAPTALNRAEVQRRRRDILAGLGLTTLASLVLGVVPPLRLLWVVALLSGALLAGYCYLLVQLKAIATERELAVRFRGAQATPVYPPLPQPRPLAQRPVAARSRYAGYGQYAGDLEPALLRRTAG